MEATAPSESEEHEFVGRVVSDGEKLLRDYPRLRSISILFDWEDPTSADPNSLSLILDESGNVKPVDQPQALFSLVNCSMVNTLETVERIHRIVRDVLNKAAQVGKEINGLEEKERGAGGEKGASAPQEGS